MASPSAARRLSGGGTGGGAAGGPTTRSKTGRPSSKFGTVNYSVDEMRRLNAKVRLVMPVVGEDWLHVAYQFNYMRPESIPYREVESLKRKFKKMYCSRASAGGKMPSYVAEAKELRHLINQRTERAQLEQQSDTHSEIDTHSEHHSHPGSTPASLGVLEDAQRPKDEAQNNPASRATRVDSQTAVEDPYASGPVDGGMSVDLDSDRLDGSEDLYRSTHDSSKDVIDAAGLPSSYEEQQKPAQQQPRASDASSSAIGLQGVDMNDSDAEENARDISAKLSQMEEEYHRTMRVKRTSSESIDMLSSTVAASSSAFASPTALATATAMLPQSSPPQVASTSGIINMLKHSIERKRRTIEEQMLSESDRVRKERKKRKMEQVLFTIHQEHRERDLMASGATDLTAAAPLSSGPPTSPRQFAAAVQAGGSTSASASFASMMGPPSIPRFMQDSSLSSMEIMLQYMIAQQEEMTRRYELEKELRRKEQIEREIRRREKEIQRRQERKELMLALAALLGDKFPDALKYHLFDPSAVDDVDESLVQVAQQQQQTDASETVDATSTTTPETSRRARMHAGDQLGSSSDDGAQVNVDDEGLL